MIPSENRSPIGLSSSFFVIRGQVRSSVTVSIVARPSNRDPSVNRCKPPDRLRKGYNTRKSYERYINCVCRCRARLTKSRTRDTSRVGENNFLQPSAFVGTTGVVETREGRIGRGKVDDRGGPSASCRRRGGGVKKNHKSSESSGCYRSDWSIGRASSTKSAANSEKSAGGATLTVILLAIYSLGAGNKRPIIVGPGWSRRPTRTEHAEEKEKKRRRRRRRGRQRRRRRRADSGIRVR